MDEAKGLKILTDKDGKPRSKFWYARFTRHGEKVDVSLAVKIQGKPPTDENGRIDLAGRGDAKFERSRAAAERALEKMREAAKVKGKTQAVRDAEAADLANRYFRARTGRAVDESPKLDKLADLWRGLVRDKPPTAERARAACATFARFADFAKTHCNGHGGGCATIDEITNELAAAWYEDIKKGYAWGTVKDQWHLMRGAWTRWHVRTGKNPFGAVIVRNGKAGAGKVERRPLTEAELARLFEVTEERPELHALVVAATCTGARLGDVCRLKWDDIDLRAGLVDIDTAKTGVRVTVPIFAPLRKVLEARAAKRAVGDSPFVFPWAAAQYEHTNAKGLPDQRTGLVRMVKPYFARAILPDAEPVNAVLADAKRKSREEVLAAIDGAGFSTAKRDRVREVYTRFRDGEKCADIAAAMKLARGQVSDYLKEAELLTGEVYRPRIERRRAAGKSSARELVQLTRVKRTIGKHSASLFGWHNLRHSFIVLALQNGVPVNDVSRIVGHGDVETTLRNYGNSSREMVAERMRRQMERRGAAIATGGAVPLIEGAGAAAKGDRKARLRELKELADDGLITPEEYAERRRAILADI